MTWTCFVRFIQALLWISLTSFKSSLAPDLADRMQERVQCELSLIQDVFLLHRFFGFVARKQGSTTDNVSHLFAEMDPDQPATAIVNFVSKVMISSQKRWTLPAALLSGGLLFCSVWIIFKFLFFVLYVWVRGCVYVWGRVIRTAARKRDRGSAVRV